MPAVFGVRVLWLRGPEARVELRIVSKYLNECVKETKKKNRNQGTKRGWKRQSGREKLVKERCTSLTSRRSSCCLKKSEANQDYGICSFTGSSSGRAEVTAAQAQKRLSAAHAPQHWRSPLEGAVEGVRDLAPFLGGGKSEWSLEGLAESQN